MTNDLCIYIEATRDVDNTFCCSLVCVYLHTMTHVKDCVHFFPVGAALFLDKFEQWRNREHIVFYHMQLVDKVKYFCLCAAAAMDHTVNFSAVFVEDATYDRSVSAGRG